MPGGGRVRLTRARSKGGEINWDRGHLANFLQALGWSHPSQMKATTDKSPKAPGANCNPTDCLQARRERTRCSCNPLSSSDFTQLCKAWEDWFSHCNGRSSPAESRGTTEDSRQRIPGHHRCSPPDITCNFPLFSQIIDPKRIRLNMWCCKYGRCYTAHFSAHAGGATMATWQQT